MNMIRHNHGDIQVITGAVAVTAAIQHDLSCPSRQPAPPPGDKCHEVRPIILLNVWQVAPIETHDEIVEQVSWAFQFS